MADHVDHLVERPSTVSGEEHARDGASSDAKHVEDAEDDSDWEYEYDADETEDIYITLDLTSRVPEDHHFPRLAVDPANGELKEVTQLSDKDAAQAGTNGDATRTTTATTQPFVQNSTTNAAPGFHRIKVADLHTANPVIVVDDKLYSCTWASTIGTDLYFAPASPSLQPLTTNNVRGRVTAPSASEYTPTHPLIGMTSARLIAQPAQLVSKDMVSEAIDTTKSHEELERKRLTDQSTFLDAFQDLKRRMGEDDPVPRVGLPPLDQAQAHYDRVGMAISRGETLTASDLEFPSSTEHPDPATGTSRLLPQTQDLDRPSSLLDVESAALSVQADPVRIAKRRPGAFDEGNMSHQSRNARKKRKHSGRLIMFADEESDGGEDGGASNQEVDNSEGEQEQSGSKKGRGGRKSSRGRNKGKR